MICRASKRPDGERLPSTTDSLPSLKVSDTALVLRNNIVIYNVTKFFRIVRVCSRFYPAIFSQHSAKGIDGKCIPDEAESFEYRGISDVKGVIIYGYNCLAKNKKGIFTQRN